MNITDKSADSLKQILNDEHDKDITTEQARRLGKWLVGFYQHLGSPIEEEEAAAKPVILPNTTSSIASNRGKMSPVRSNNQWRVTK